MTKSYLDWQKEFESKISKGKIAINKFEFDSRLGINRKEFDAFLSNWKKENLNERLII